MPANSYLQYIGLNNLLGAKRQKPVIHANPTVEPVREEAKEVKVFVYDYNSDSLDKRELSEVRDCIKYKENNRVSWINIDGLRKADVEMVCNMFDIHNLIAEDIVSINQRPKMDEVDDILFCLLNMLYFNEKTLEVEQEQISIILGKGYVISFQEDAVRDVFDPLREKLNTANTKLRQRGADYLCYTMLDMIVDNYFLVLERLGEKIEDLEEEVVNSRSKRSLVNITFMKKELQILKRNITPIRELINGFMRSESDLLEDRTTKYFKDVYDHIVQASDMVENYRDMMMSMQDLYLNNVNLRMNEVMKVMAVVTCLMAPATVIGGIFGMNFDRIPAIHNRFGFFIAVAAMLLIPLWMLWGFKRKGWF